MIQKEEISGWFENLQEEICEALEALDGEGKFQEDQWQREGGGGGKTRIFNQGQLIEKGGVNFSEVHGKTPEKIIKALELSDADFFATGISIVLHPFNPWIPIIHMNLRYFEMSSGDNWFGGGIDVTPHYIDIDDAKYFHQKLKHACDQHDNSYYPKFKKWADDYFFIKHRNETRGVGGIFFDRLAQNENKDKAGIFSFVKEIGSVFMPIYRHLVTENRMMSFGDKEKHWQSIRRGRYVEFNLVWDKGTKFGLDTNGRTESILMSLPPQAQWKYDYQAPVNSEEAKTQFLLKKGINWLEIK